MKFSCFRKRSNDPLHIQAYMKVIIDNQSVWLPESQIEELRLRSFPLNYSTRPVNIITTINDNNSSPQLNDVNKKKLSRVEGDPKKLLNKKPKIQKIWTCNLCKKIFMKQASYNSHCQLKHKNVKKGSQPRRNKKCET